MRFHKHLEHKFVDNLLRSIKKTNCHGTECLQKRGEDGFFNPGKKPWIGYPTTMKVHIMSRK